MVREFALIASLAPYVAGDGPGIPLGVGDDAAVVEIAGTPVAIAVDELVDGVHFDRSISSWHDVGWKALAVNVSDLAAIGACTRAAVCAVTVPDVTPQDAIVDIYAGMAEAARRWDVAIVGGDVTSGPAVSVAVTVIGDLIGPAPLRRDGARPGDVVVVRGALGEAAAGLALARAGATDVLDAHPTLLEAHRRPLALPEVGLQLVEADATACIDVSDGLGRDLGHIAERSQVGIRLRSADLPISDAIAAAADHLGSDPTELVIGGGDDYALAATLPPSQAGLAWTVIGEVVAGSGVLLDGRDVSTAGWEHG